MEQTSPGAGKGRPALCPSISRQKNLDKGDPVMSLESIIVTITPDRLREIQRLPVIPAHAGRDDAAGLPRL